MPEDMAQPAAPNEKDKTKATKLDDEDRDLLLQLMQLQTGVARQLRNFMVEQQQKGDMAVGDVAAGGGIRTVGPMAFGGKPRRRLLRGGRR